MSSRRPSSSEVDGRRVRWQAHREARRRALIDAAVRAVRKHGSSVGMDQIAAEAETSKPVVYRYFTDKADLYLAVGQQVAQGLVDRITSALEGHTGGRAMVAAGVDAYLRVIEEEPELYRFVVRHALVDGPVENDPVADSSSMLGTYLSRRLGDIMREVGFDSGAAEPWGFGLVGLVRSAGEWWLERQSMSRQALADYLTTLMWTGLAGGYRSVGVGPAETDSPVDAPEGHEGTVRRLRATDGRRQPLAAALPVSRWPRRCRSNGRAPGRVR